MTVGESAGRFTIVPPASDVRCHQAQRSRMEAHGTNCKHGLDRDAVVRDDYFLFLFIFVLRLLFPSLCCN